MNKFGEGRELLKNRLLEMGSLVEDGVRRCIRAVMARDSVAVKEVFANEVKINNIQLEIDDLAINLLALHQPMASSLRFVVAALKINTDLERMGDLSVNIAHSATSLIDGQAMGPVVDIPHMARLVQSMVRNSLDAFVSDDVDLARSVLASDDAVDHLRKACYHPVIAFMESDPQNVRSSVVFLSVAGTLERIADHSTNIAENVLFYVQGVDVRHNSGHQPLDHSH